MNLVYYIGFDNENGVAEIIGEGSNPFFFTSKRQAEGVLRALQQMFPDVVTDKFRVYDSTIIQVKIGK